MKSILRSGFLALAIMAHAGPAHAGPLEDGLFAYKHGDDATALQFWQPLAEQGDAQAQYYLGTMYYNGLGVPQEHILGCMWFDIAAASGSESAINSPDFFARMSPDQITEAQRMAREWMAKHHP
jgi:hypothetical protein